MPVFHSLTLASSLAQQQVFHWCMWFLSLGQWGLEWLVEWVKTKATDAKHTDYIIDRKVAEYLAESTDEWFDKTWQDSLMEIQP